MVRMAYLCSIRQPDLLTPMSRIAQYQGSGRWCRVFTQFYSWKWFQAGPLPRSTCRIWPVAPQSTADPNMRITKHGGNVSHFLVQGQVILHHLHWYWHYNHKDLRRNAANIICHTGSVRMYRLCLDYPRSKDDPRATHLNGFQADLCLCEQLKSWTNTLPGITV